MFVILLCYTINYGIVSMVTILFLYYTHHMLFVVVLDLPFVVVAKWINYLVQVYIMVNIHIIHVVNNGSYP